MDRLALQGIRVAEPYEERILTWDDFARHREHMRGHTADSMRRDIGPDLIVQICPCDVVLYFERCHALNDGKRLHLRGQRCKQSSVGGYCHDHKDVRPTK